MRVDGKVVATSKSQLNVPGLPFPHLFYPLTVNENGGKVLTTAHVISGLDGGDCRGWDTTAQGDTYPGIAVVAGPMPD